MIGNKRNQKIVTRHTVANIQNKLIDAYKYPTVDPVDESH